MKKEIQDTVKEVLEFRNAVLNVQEGIEESVELGKGAVSQLENELSVKQDDLSSVTDMAEAKQLKAEIDGLKSDIELQQSVNKAKSLIMMSELEDKAVQFFDKQRKAISHFNTIDTYFLNTSSISTMKEDIEFLQDIALDLNNSFKSVRHILLDTGIVSVAEQNKSYKGHHLGKRDVVSELVSFEYKIRPITNQLKQAGKINITA